jgi:hypothetical protein
VRYADTHGIHFDNYRAIWPYRDYVIRAFNAEQALRRLRARAARRRPAAGPHLRRARRHGFVRCNMTTNEGGTITEEVYVNQTRDRVEAFGATFLGLTTGCAACHDHKFDPLTMRDFYGLAAFLGNTLEKPWDLNIAEPPPVLRLPKPETSAAAEFVLKSRAGLQEKIEARRARSRELTAAWLAAGNRPEPVSTDNLEVRLRFDEGRGDLIRNHAPGAKVPSFQADTNPLIWGENSWLWPSMRMDIQTRLSLGDHGDVDAGDRFSAGGWIMLRAKPGGGVRTGTGNGTLLARMGDAKRRGGAGWDLAQEGLQIVVSLVPEGAATAGPAGAGAVAVATPAPKRAAGKKATAPPPPAVKRGLQVATRPGQIVRDEWIHVFFTYDGSRRAAGVKLYLNGRPAEVEVRLDALGPKESIRTDAAMHVGRRDDFNPMRETRFQDVRFYRRALTPVEVARLPFEDVASEIVARQAEAARWTSDEKFIVADRFFLGEKDAEARNLQAALAAHDTAFEALTRDGTPTLIAIERTTPAYADILKRGDYFARQERVEPGVPHFLPGLPAGAPRNRRGLAEWLLAPEQPLMARVAVNRMWQEVFGRGLVESAGRFWRDGRPPSHPELLDWLAVEFRESGWDVKRFYRLLVTSAAYRQTASATAERLAKGSGEQAGSRAGRVSAWTARCCATARWRRRACWSGSSAGRR